MFRSEDEFRRPKHSPYKRKVKEDRTQKENKDSIRKKTFVLIGGKPPQNAVSLIEWLGKENVQWGQSTTNNLLTITWFGPKYER